MHIYKAKITIEGESKIYDADVIKYEGQFWLVPEWLERPTEGYRTPERIVLLDSLEHQKLENSAFGDFLVKTLLPRDVLYGPDPSSAGDGFVVHMLPPARDEYPASGVH